MNLRLLHDQRTLMKLILAKWSLGVLISEMEFGAAMEARQSIMPLMRQKMTTLFGEDYSLISSISVFVTLLLVCMLIGHLLHTTKWVNESITSLILGLCAGTVVFVTSKGKSSHVLYFNEDLFFLYLLPPIIFNAGFQVKKKKFFENFFAIMLFGIIGVFISVAIIAITCKLVFPMLGVVLPYSDIVAIGVIFSATDSVCTLQVLHQDETPLLYSLVFGEGVMNDASSIVLFNALQNLDLSEITASKIFNLIGNFLYLFVTSTLLGIFVGLASAFIIKKLYVGRHSTDREIAIMILMAYLSYMLAEFLDLSGILTVFFCGIVMSHYTWHNVTESSRITTRHIFATLSFIAETFIFLYVGMDALDKDKWEMTNVGFLTSLALCGALLFSILLGRAAFVFPLSALANFVRKTPRTRISFRNQVIIWWAGLMRGAVSIALAYNQFTVSGTTGIPVHATVITTTIIVVLSSTVVFGLLTKPIVDWLAPHHLRSVSEHSSPASSPKESLSNGELDVALLRHNFPDENTSMTSRSLGMLFCTPSWSVHHFWRMCDDTYMRPMFGGRRVETAPEPALQDSGEPIANS